MAGWSRRQLPCLVIRAALQGAVSVAGLLITTEAMVAETPSKTAPRALPCGGDLASKSVARGQSIIPRLRRQVKQEGS